MTAAELQAQIEAYRARGRSMAARVREREDDLVASAVSGTVAAAAGYARGRWADNYGSGMILGAPAEAVGGVALLGLYVAGYVKHPAAKAAGDALIAVYAFQRGLSAGLEADQRDKAAGK